MTHVVPWSGPQPRKNAAPRVLYIGPAADEICALVTNHVGRIDIAYESEVQAAFAHMRRRAFDVVLVDQRDENLATRLILPVLQSLGYPVKPVVISTLKDVGQYLAIPGVARVLSAPVKEVQLLRVLGLERRQRPEELQPPKPAEKPLEKPVKKIDAFGLLSNRFMNLVSMLYKRAAFILLFVLFITFVFYGVLIGFFLLSSGWGAPMTLTRGHEMVNRVEREITEVKVALNQTDQRLSEQALALTTAGQEFKEASALVKYAAGTVKKELQSRARLSKTLQQSQKRLKKVRSQLREQLDGNGPSGDIEKLYKRRLIDRNAYSAAAMNMTQAAQNLAAVETQIDEAEAQLADLQTSKTMLDSLYAALVEDKGLSGIDATSSDLLLLTKQSSDALAARELAKSKKAATDENTRVLMKSKQVLESQLATHEQTALARAMHERIDVVFVPYGNENRFVPGAAVYSCALTIMFCEKAGVVGDVLPGEISSVHPFFGKPIRGRFVEMKLDTPDAAMREIIHGTRKPLFF
jgi:hypothetical protein